MLKDISYSNMGNTIEFRTEHGTRLSTFGILSCFTGFLVLHLFWQWRKLSSKSVQIPGVRRYWLGRILNVFELTNKRKTIQILHKWSVQQGPIFRVDFGPFQVISLNSASMVQKIYGSTEMSCIGKSFLYKVFQPVAWFDGLLSSKGKKWKSRRKLLSYIVEYKSLRSYVQILNKESRELVQTLEMIFRDGKEAKPVEHELMNAALACVTRATIGMDIHDMNQFIHSISRLLEIGATRILNPWLLIEPIWRLHPLSRETEKIVEYTSNVVSKLIEEYKGRKALILSQGSEDEEGLGRTIKGKNLLQDMIDEGVDFRGIVEETITLIGAGYETTATALHFVLFLLALHPEHQERCRKEVDSVIEDSKLCPDEDISQNGIHSLKYLERCILETLRLCPVVFISMRKIDAPVQISDNLELPSGTNVGFTTQAIHMNPEYYPNPEEFNPDRFLFEEIQKRHPYAYVPFSAGPRKCIGYKFAMMELVILSARILRHFVIRTNDKFEDVVFLPYVTLRPETPMKFTFQKRNDIKFFCQGEENIY